MAAKGPTKADLDLIHMLGATKPVDLEVDKVKSAVEAADDVNAKDDLGYTALHQTCEKGHHPDVLAVLLEAKADVNAVTSGNMTGLTIACQNGHTLLVEALLARQKRTPRPYSSCLACATSHNARLSPMLSSFVLRREKAPTWKS